MKPVYKHLMMFALLCVAGWTTLWAQPTYLLTENQAAQIEYSWSDGTTVRTSNLAQTATSPIQIYSLLRCVYMDTRVPGPYTASYEGPSTQFNSSYYTQDASVNNPNGSASYFLNDSYESTPGREVYYGPIGQGWNINGSDYTPDHEGYTVMLVAVKDSYQTYANDTYYPSGSHLSDSVSVVQFLDRMVDSVMVITNSVRVNEGTKNSGAVFNCSAYLNRFFFLSKGQARDISYGQDLYSTWYNKASRSSSYPSTSYFGNQSPFAEMFEQFSPNNGYVDTDASFSDITDIYSQLTAGATYNIRHDCPSALMQHHDFSVAGAGNTEHMPLGGLNLFVPDYRLESWFQTVSWVWASISSSGTITETTTQVDARSMYDDATFCQNGSSYVSGYNPYWTLDSHTGLYVTYDYDYIGSAYPTNRSSALYHFYNPHHFPKMNLYAIQLKADTTGVKRVEDGTTYYQIKVSWTSSLANLVGNDGLVEYFHLYTVGASGAYSSLLEINSDEFTTVSCTIENGEYVYYYEVPQEEYSQSFTYIVSGQPVNNGVVYFTPTWSNEDDVFIPGWNRDEFLRLALVDNISQYTTAGEFNNYNNKLKVYQGTSPWLANDLATGDNLLHFVRIDDQGEETEFATLNYYRGGPAIFTSTNDLNMQGVTSKTFKVNTSGITGTVTLTASSGFSVSPSSFTATGSDHTITVTRTSGATGTITISSTTSGANTQVVNVTYGSTQSPYTTIDYGSMEGTSLSASTDEKGGTWTYTGTGSYAYGLSGSINGVNYMYFTSDGSATYTFPTGMNLSHANVAITVQSGAYGTGNLYVNGSSIRYNGSTTTNTFSNVDVSSGKITITSPNGSSGSSSYSLRIRSISIYLVDDTEYPTTGNVVIKPQVNYVYANAANNTSLNYTARPFANGDTTWLASAIDYVNDVFSAYTGDNTHSAYYNYYVTMADSEYTGPTILRPSADIVMESDDQMVQVKGTQLTTGATITTTGDFTVSPASLTREQATAGTAIKLNYTGNAAPGTTVTGTMTVTSGTATSTVNITYTVPDVPVLVTSTSAIAIDGENSKTVTFTVSGSNLGSDIYLSGSPEGLVVSPAYISAADAMSGPVTVTVKVINADVNYTGTITVSCEGAADKIITVNYTAPEQPAVPTITVSTSELAIQGPNVTGTFTVTGTALTGDINVSTSNSDFTVVNNDGTVTVTYTGDATVGASTVITVSSDGAQSQTVNVTYSPATVVATPTLSVSPASVAIDGNEGTTGTFTVTGSDLTGNVVITAPAGFTVSPASITPTGGSVNQTVTITADGAATSGTITVTSPGATAQAVDVTYTAPSQGGYNTGDVLGSLDFTGMTSGNNALSSPWGGNVYYTSYGSTTYATISYGYSVTFTVPSGVSNESVTVAIKTTNNNSGAGKFKINGNTYTATKGIINYFVVNGVNSGDTITISGNNDTSPRIDVSTPICIYYGNYSGN